MGHHVKIKLTSNSLLALLANYYITQGTLSFRKTLDKELNSTRHVDLSFIQTYGKLKRAFGIKNFLSDSSKLNLIEIRTLPWFEYADVILQNSTKQLQNKIIKITKQMYFFTINLYKYNHLSAFFKEI